MNIFNRGMITCMFFQLIRDSHPLRWRNVKGIAAWSCSTMITILQTNYENKFEEEKKITNMRLQAAALLTSNCPETSFLCITNKSGSYIEVVIEMFRCVSSQIRLWHFLSFLLPSPPILLDLLVWVYSGYEMF